MDMIEEVMIIWMTMCSVLGILLFMHGSRNKK